MRIFLIISSLLLTSACVFIWVEKGFSLSTVGGFLFFGGSSALFIFQDRWTNWIQQRKQKKITSSNCEIKPEGFYFPQGYYFKQGCLKNRPLLPFSEIKEIRINTFPITAVTHQKEVIFLPGLQQEEVEKLAFEKNLKLVEPVDIWSLICDEFLDTEFSEEEKARCRKLLEEQGISPTELEQIRKKIKTKMLLLTAVSWEWMYYGQYDVLLELRPLTEKKYWWTMDIALRNA